MTLSGAGDKLTDAQVAELASGTYSTPAAEDVVVFKDREQVSPFALLERLALEVQQARQRRCGACRHWHRPVEWTHDDGPDAGLCQHDRWVFPPMITEDWFCADFQAKEAGAQRPTMTEPTP